MVLIVSGYWLLPMDARPFVEAVYPDDEERPEAGSFWDPVSTGYCIARIAKWLGSVREREHTVGFSCEYTTQTCEWAGTLAHAGCRVPSGELRPHCDDCDGPAGPAQCE